MNIDNLFNRFFPKAPVFETSRRHFSSPSKTILEDHPYEQDLPSTSPEGPQFLHLNIEVKLYLPPPSLPSSCIGRFVTSADQAQAKAMCNVGMRTSQIMDFMVHQSGGYEKVGFIHRDLHNQFQAEHKVQLAEGDAEGALGYLSAKLDADPLFFFKYNVDKDNRLDKIFWADGTSRMDYAAFGDVLVCELDLIFNFHKAYYILDELLIAGELQESSKKTVARLIATQDSLVEAAKE
ncbi:hypothetical protein ACSBR2_027983 [Camellia fascicularis]